MAPTGNLTSAKPIPSHPWLVSTLDPLVWAFLDGLATADFGVIADNEGRWAVPVNDDEAGTAFVVSARVYRDVQARAYLP